MTTYFDWRQYWRRPGGGLLGSVTMGTPGTEVPDPLGEFTSPGGISTIITDDVMRLSNEPHIPRTARGTLVPFKDDCWLYDDISAAPLHANAAQYRQALLDDILPYYNGVAALNFNQYNSAFYPLLAGQLRTHDFEFDDCQNKGSLPADFAPVLQDVPIPAHAQPAAGRDANVTLYDLQTDRLWEYWKVSRDPNTAKWAACWGGLIDDTRASDATFPGFLGSTATGISQTALIVSIDEARRGVINHCVGFVMQRPQRGHVWPAKRSDGYLNDASKPKEGTRFRLPQSVDLDALNLHPVAKAIAVAAKTHGMILFDKAGAVAVTCESGERYENAGQPNPWTAILNGTPGYNVLKRFPWSELEAIADDYNRPT